MHPQQQEIVLVFEGVGGLGAIFISNLEAANNSNTLRSIPTPRQVITSWRLCPPEGDSCSHIPKK